MCVSVSAVNNMKRSALCLLTVALAFVTLLSAVEVAPQKDGVCPAPTINTDARLGLCMTQCSTDWDCERNLKCCYTGCGHLCLEPLRVPKPKPGSCPRADGFGICISTCSSDQDCEKNLKCCSNGCGQTCQAPVMEVPKPKPGSCPRADGFGICISTCSSDQDCEKNLKCCSNGCGQTCQEPVISTKPGSCPAPIPHFTTCDDQCADDSQCDKNLKCCYSGCGYECMTPEHGNHKVKGQ